jgi:hypothetical protein
MDTQTLILRTTISSALKRHLLFRGTFYSSIGALIILASGMYMPSILLSERGFFIFLGSLAMILIGLRPYRQLSRLEQHPEEVHLLEDSLVYFSKGNPLFSIPYNDIQKIHYFDDKSTYGITLYFKKNIRRKWPLIDFFKRLVNFSTVQLQPSNKLFLPYFNKKAFAQMIKKGPFDNIGEYL